MSEVSIRTKLVSKLKVTGIHLLISFVIFLIVLYLILVNWYPEPFFTAEGGWKGIRLMFLVDMVLGPSLTFIIYNILKSQKEKIFDFSVIGVIQLTALIWGGSQVYSQRPIAVVYWDNMFYTVTADYFSQQNIEARQVKALSERNPAWLYAEDAGDLESNKKMLELIEQKIPPYAQFQILRPLNNFKSTLIKASTNPEVIQRCNKALYSKISNDSENSLIFQLVAKYEKFILQMDQDLKLLGVYKLDTNFKCENTT